MAAARAVLAIAVVLAGVGVAAAYRPLFLGNLGVVDEGKVFRTAQPAGNWAGLVGDLKIATVLNLRGGSEGDGWYAEEVQETEKAHVEFYDIHMSATRRPSKNEVLTLVDLFSKCKYPLLIHCKSGADRTGLASAIYMMVGMGAGPDEAMGAFTFKHGHVPVGGPQRLHEPIREYAEWLGKTGARHSPEGFRAWVEGQYRGDRDEPPYQPVRSGPRPQVREAPAIASRPEPE